MTDQIRINLLGPIEIQVGAKRTSARPGRKTQALLAYLVASGRMHTRRELYERFCGAADDPAAALRWHLNRIRHWLGQAVIVGDGDRLQFNPWDARVDYIEFERVLGTTLERQTIASLRAAVELFRDEFLVNLSLPDAPEFELWLLGERARLRRLYERGLNELIARLITAEQFELAIHYAQQLVQSNPLLEQAHALLIWLYAQTHQHQAALQQFERCCELLQRELAVEPTPELVALHADVRAGRFGRPPTIAVVPTPATLDLRQAASFAGREAEMEKLGQVWQMARQGHGSVVLIAAEAGGGKTRLAHEFARCLQDSSPPALFLMGQCYESTRALPYHPWVGLLETRLAQLDDGLLYSLSSFWLDQLTRLLPTLAGRRGRGAVSAPPTTGGELGHLFAAVSEFLFCFPDTLPLLLFVDDLQWADEASLRLFHFLSRRLPQTRALLMGAFRTEELDDVPALQALLSDLRRNSLTELSLTPFTAETIAALTAQLWPRLPAGDRPNVCAMLTKATGGNPLFVTEILRELAQAAEMPADMPVPPAVRALIGRRLGKLSESGRQVLQAIAVLDSPVTLSEAQQTSGRSEEETVAAIDMGLRWGLLTTKTPPQPTHYDFSHDLVREVVAGQLSDARRRLLHRRAAAMLVKTAGRVPALQRQELAGRITHHAIEGEVNPLILAWAPLAAERAKRLNVYTDALAVYEAASAALARMHAAGELDTPTAEQHQLELVLSRIEILSRLGKRDEEAASLQTAAELLARQHAVRLEAAFHLGRAAYLSKVNEYASAFEAAQLAYERYRQLGDSLCAARCLFVCGDAKQSLSENKTAIHLLEEALALYRAAGDQGGANLCLAQLAGCLVDMGEIAAAMGRLEQSLEIARNRGDLFALAYTYSGLATAWCFYYDVEKIRACGKESLRLFHQLGNDWFAARSNLFLSVSCWIQEDWAQARAFAEEALEAAVAQRFGWLEGWSAQMMGRLELHAGDLPAAEYWLQRAYQVRRQLGEAQNQVSDLAWLGRLRVVQGDPILALDHTSEALARLDALREQVRVLERSDVYLCHAEALAAAGREAAARAFVLRAYEDMMQFAEQIRDAQVKQGFLTAPANRRILHAWKSGQIRSYRGDVLQTR